MATTPKNLQQFEYLYIRTLSCNSSILKYLLPLVFIFILGCPITRSETPQLWDSTHFRILEKEETRLDLTLHGRLSDELSKVSLFQIQPKLSHQVAKGLRLGLNYSYFFVRRTNDNSGEDQYLNQNRVEFEVMPEFKPIRLFNLAQRTRYEYLMDNDFRKLNSRLRHRMQLISEPVNDGGLRFFTGTELFYDIGASSFNQARTIPIGLRFPILQIDWSISPMWLALKQDSGWEHAAVVQLETWIDFMKLTN